MIQSYVDYCQTVHQLFLFISDAAVVEAVFGQLDHGMKTKPNASLLTHESHIVHGNNRTGPWLSSLSDEKLKVDDQAWSVL